MPSVAAGRPPAGLCLRDSADLADLRALHVALSEQFAARRSVVEETLTQTALTRARSRRLLLSNLRIRLPVEAISPPADDRPEGRPGIVLPLVPAPAQGL